jgi:hypothetical protein
VANSNTRRRTAAGGAEDSSAETLVALVGMDSVSITALSAAKVLVMS